MTGHGSNLNPDNGDGKKSAVNSSAALQGATLAFASRASQKRVQSSVSPKAAQVRPVGPSSIENGARKAAMIAGAGTHSPAASGASLEADEDDDSSSSYGIRAVRDTIQLFSRANDNGGSTAAAPVSRPIQSSKSATLRNSQATYNNTASNTSSVTQPNLGPQNPQHIAAKLAVDRSLEPKTRSRSTSRPVAATPVNSQGTRGHQELITQGPQREFRSRTTRNENNNIDTFETKGNDQRASPSSEVADATMAYAVRKMTAQGNDRARAVPLVPPPILNRSVIARSSPSQETMNSEPDQGKRPLLQSHQPPPTPPPRQPVAGSPPPSPPPRRLTTQQTKEKPPPPAPRNSTAKTTTTESPAIERLAAPRGPLPIPPSRNPNVHPLPLPQTRPIPLLSQHSGVSESSLADAIAASSLASSRASSPSKQHQPSLPPRRRSRSRSFLHVTHSGNAHDHRNGQNRTPSPNKSTMKRTMRATAQNEVDPLSGGHRPKEHSHRRLIRRHPNKHHEGDRKRWRDQVTAAERKRYEGVWAANKGLWINVHEQVNVKDKSVALNDMVVSMVVRDIWTRSQLPAHLLEQIWNIVSHHAYGLLSREEFVVGMWLIDQCLKGHKLPVKVSQSVWDSVKSVSAELVNRC